MQDTSTPRAPTGAGAQRPLEGVRIIDMTSVVYGPLCTQILADYGADVIKIEPPEGDFSRHAGPSRTPGIGPMYLNLNRNKRSVMLDLRSDPARQTVLRMCAQSDMFITNVRPAAIERLGLGYEAVAAARPDIVYMSLVGFGQNGPSAARPVVDDTLQAECAMTSLFTYTQADGAPQYVPFAVADRIAGISAAHAALAALMLRGRTGAGQFVEVPMFETLAATVLGDHLGGQAFSPAAGPMGYTRMLNPHRRPHRTRDGYVSAVIYMEKHWQRFLAETGHAHLLTQDPRFASAAARARNYPEIYRFLDEVFLTRSTAQWLALCEANDIPCAKVESLDSLMQHRQLVETGFFSTSEHPQAGTVVQMPVPSRWSSADMRPRRHAPALGEHTTEVLTELGFSQAECDALTRREEVLP